MNGTVNCEGVSVGGVPHDEALRSLREQGIRTLVDAREPDEAAGDALEDEARALGLKYLRAPISRKRVDVHQIDTFRSLVADAANAPVYAFSSGGKRPAGVLCFLACARMGESVLEVFHKAQACGCSIDKEFALKHFILDFYSSHRGDMLNNHFQHHPAGMAG